MDVSSNEMIDIELGMVSRTCGCVECKSRKPDEFKSIEDTKRVVSFCYFTQALVAWEMKSSE